MADIFERNGFRPASQQEPAKRKIGEGHVAAMGRLGLRELRNAANPSRESVADAEMGLYGTVTPGTVAEQQGRQDRGNHNQERPQGRQNQAGQSQDRQPGKDAKERQRGQ